MSEYKRLTTSEPKTSEEWLLNVAYAKNGEVYLRSVDSGEDIRLCEYISKLATAKGCHCSPEDVLNGACSECDCEINLLYILAIQSAELRNRLAELEDKIESGLGFIVPCNVGDTVWYLNTTPSMTLARNAIYEGKLVRYHILNYPQPLGTCVLADIQIHNEYGTTEIPDVKGFGKIWFINKAQAEARLKELKGEQ